jgi:shikimate dehydrogenase
MEFRFALAGDPVAHSLSPAMHHAALKESGLSGTYDLVQCDEAGFRDLVRLLASGDYSGLNVTMPHKGLAHSLCDDLTPEADTAASVNTMRAGDSSISGHSSDVIAFRKAFAEVGHPTSAILMGTGGSARAALAGFDGEVHLWGRSPERVESFASRYPGRVFPLHDAPAGAVLVNCTPLGMNGEELPSALLESSEALIDLPYGRGETPAVSAARRAGIPLVDGYRFLAVQAAESFRWWTGVEVDIDTMVDAARNG